MTPVKAVLGTLASPTIVTAWSKQKYVSQSYWKMGGEVPAPQSSELQLQQPRRRQRAEESRMPCISLTPLICPHFSLFIFDRPREGLGITNNEVGEGIGTDKMDRALQDVKLAESSVCPLKSLGWLLTLMGWRQTPEEAFYFSEKTKLTKGQSSWHSCKSGSSSNQNLISCRQMQNIKTDIPSDRDVASDSRDTGVQQCNQSLLKPLWSCILGV